MSVIVKGINIPKNCYVCAKSTWSPLCPILKGNAQASYYRAGRHPDCPIVELPPHSDLIDRDALITEVMDSDLDHLQRDDWKEIIQIVEDAPAIIEGNS